MYSATNVVTLWAGSSAVKVLSVTGTDGWAARFRLLSVIHEAAEEALPFCRVKGWLTASPLLTATMMTLLSPL
ncbi:hypothetical protein D3C76_1786000 [compost metagenome]